MENINTKEKSFPDFVYSDDFRVLDRGIKDAIKKVQFYLLSIGVALARAQKYEIYYSKKCSSMNAYIIKLSESTKFGKTTLYNWLKIGKEYFEYEGDLKKIGFSDSDSPTKLLYLKQALTAGNRAEVFDKLKNMKCRDFIKFANSNKSENSDTLPGQFHIEEIFSEDSLMDNGSVKNDDKDTVPFYERRGNVIYIQGETAFIVNGKLDEKYREMLLDYSLIVCRAMEKGGVVTVVHHRNEREADLFEIEARRIRAEIQR